MLLLSCKEASDRRLAPFCLSDERRGKVNLSPSRSGAPYPSQKCYMYLQARRLLEGPHRGHIGSSWELCSSSHGCRLWRRRVDLHIPDNSNHEHLGTILIKLSNFTVTKAECEYFPHHRMPWYPKTTSRKIKSMAGVFPQTEGDALALKPDPCTLFVAAIMNPGEQAWRRQLQVVAVQQKAL